MTCFKRRLFLATAVLGLVALTVGVHAHHSYVPKYDPKRKLLLTGVITSVEYFNPHIFFTIRLTEPRGGGTDWIVETESIPKAQARGLTKKRLAVGARVTVTGWPARTGERRLGMSTIRLPGGRTISMRRRPR